MISTINSIVAVSSQLDNSPQGQKLLAQGNALGWLRVAPSGTYKLESF